MSALQTNGGSFSDVLFSFGSLPPRSARIAHCVRARVQANKSFHYAVAVGTTPQAVATGDFNGDLNLDIAIANGNSDSVTVLTGDGIGGFETLPSISVA